MQIPLIRGRLFTDQDTAASRPVVLINETLARRYFPDEDAIGKRLDISGLTNLREIIGIVGDVKQEGLRTPTPPQVYEPFLQKPSKSFFMVVRGVGDPMRLAEAVRQQVLAADKYQPISDIRTLEDRLARSVTRDWFAAFLLGLFAILALALAAVGIYGVMAYSVTQRTQEIGIRIALGAHPRSILRLVLGQSLRTVLLGLGIGLAGSVALTRVLGSLLYEVTPRDPVTIVSVSTLLFAVALVAALVPARRAANVDPMVALHYE
jgi:predicted permease